MQGKLTIQGKRGKKVTKWSVQILESGVGRAGFVEVPDTLWKKVPEEVRCGRKGLRFESERREVVQRGVAEVRCRARKCESAPRLQVGTLWGRQRMPAWLGEDEERSRVRGEVPFTAQVALRVKVPA